MIRYAFKLLLFPLLLTVAVLYLVFTVLVANPLSWVYGFSAMDLEDMKDVIHDVFETLRRDKS